MHAGDKNEFDDRLGTYTNKYFPVANSQFEGDPFPERSYA